MKVINLRLAIDDNVDVEYLAKALGENLESVLGVTELRNDGFGRLLPQDAHVFVTDESYTDIYTALKRGHVA